MEDIETIRYYMYKNKLNQKQLADVLDYSEAFISHMMNGKAPIPSRVMEIICG
jgi:predicted XRE-type DNA-binding protein